MEFDELQKIWDTQNKQPMYAINEQAMHSTIVAKKDQARHITNFSELLVIVINIATGITILLINFLGEGNNIFIYVLSLWMLSNALYFTLHRVRRKSTEKEFDRSMYGELQHAVSLATYQVRLSQYGRWSMIPGIILVLLALWQKGQSPWVIVGMTLFFVFAFVAARWEHGIYKRKKRELEALKEKFDSFA